jgi:inosose dehydratase
MLAADIYCVEVDGMVRTMQLGYHTITWGGVVAAPAGVTSVKDLYYRAGGSMEQAIRDIGAAGYAGIEMFDGNLVDYADRPEELNSLLREAGVELVSVYTGANFLYADALPDEMHRIRVAAELAARFRAQTLAVGGGARRASGTTDGDYAALAQSLDAVADLAESFGLAASFHPHLGTIVEGPDEVNTVLTRSRIGFCPDTAHLAAGGGDPAELIRRHAGRVDHVHLKDLHYDTTTFLPLGKGELDLPAVLAAIREAGYDDWLIVELDYYDGDPREAAESSRSYLDTLLH